MTTRPAIAVVAAAILLAIAACGSSSQPSTPGSSPSQGGGY